MVCNNAYVDLCCDAMIAYIYYLKLAHCNYHPDKHKLINNIYIYILSTSTLLLFKIPIIIIWVATC